MKFFHIYFFLFLIACTPKTSPSIGRNTSPKDVLKKGGSTNKTVKDTIATTAKTPEPKPQILPLSIPEGIDSQIVISLKKTPCIGQCRVFEATIYRNGQVVFDGKSYVPKLGRHTTVVSEIFIKKIQEKALELRFFDLSGNYPLSSDPILEDFPTVITYLRVGEGGKLIENNYDAPRQLIEFERYLEREILLLFP